MTDLRVEPGGPLRGTLRVPGCKGISHRALLLAAIADGTSEIRGLADGADVRSTRRALEHLDLSVSEVPGGVRVVGRGFDMLSEPDDPIDCGNSGTTMRMLAGMLAGRPMDAVLTGDASLSRRPMGRVVEPLRALGARIETVDGHAPLTIAGRVLVGAEVDLGVSSGQVKSAVILAGLQASGTTTVREPAPSRDHTERMLAALGAPIERLDACTVRVGTIGALDRFEVDIPGDASSAAFLVVAAAIVPGSEVTIVEVNLNPGRIAYLEILRAMGADIDVVARGERLGEPVGDLTVRSAPLRGVRIVSDEGIVDELPILAVAGAAAEGRTEIVGAAELRVKESDRIETTTAMLRAFGVTTETTSDGLVVDGGTLRAASVDSSGDHRIAMCAAVAALRADGASTITGWEAVDVSYPGFAADLAGLRGDR
ncbi:MAG: 3-phosphoshikimate 1-carboxyvinyltransferase [Actinomycetes bacterium]